MFGQDAAEPVPEISIYGSPARDSTYASHDQVTGTRETRDVGDVPQAISVVSRTLLEDTSARRTDDVMLLVPSVQQGAGFGSVWDDYAVRGFRVWAGTMHRNGFLAGYSGIGAADTVNVERIEVLRGPSAALYGPGLPGGTINVVTKEPSFRQRAKLAVALGSFDTQRYSLDVTGPLAEPAAYRVTGSFDTTDSARDFNTSQRLLVNPSVALKLGKTRLLLETQFFSMRYRPDALGVPAINGDFFRVPAQRSYIEPETKLSDFRGGLVRGELRHELGRDITLRVGVQRQAGFLDEPATYSMGVDPARQSLGRIATHFWSHSEDIALQVGLEAGFKTGNLEHDLMVGTDARFETVDWRIATSDPAADFAIDLLRPDYSKSIPPILDAAVPDNSWSYRLLGVYVSDRIRLLPELALSLGVRGDGYQQNSEVPAAAVDDEAGELAPSARAGLLYAPARLLSFYGSINRGFWPVIGVTADGRLLKPEHNWGLEAGGRFALPNDAVTLDLSLFRTENQNISVPDPARPDFQLQRGAARAQGIELEGSARLHRNFRGVASYTLSDARITADTDPSRIDQRLPGVPSHSGAVWLFASPLGEKVGTGVGAGAILVGRRHLNDGARLPRYARLDVVLSQRLGAFKLQLRAENLLDTRYVRGGNDATSFYFGAPRNFLASLSANF